MELGFEARANGNFDFPSWSPFLAKEEEERRNGQFGWFGEAK